VLRVLLLNEAGARIVDVGHDDADLVVRYRRPADSTWQTVTLVAGTPSTYTSAGWVAAGNGWHEFGLPNAAIVPGQRTEIEIVYDTNKPQIESIDAIIPPIDPQQIASLVVDGFGSSSVLLSVMGRFATASELNLRQGDDYDNTIGTAFEKQIELAGFDFDAAGLTVRFGAGSVPGTSLLSGTASLHDKAVGSAKLRLEFTRSQTTAIAQGTYNWDAELVTAGGKVITIDGGTLNVQSSWTTLA